MKIIVELVKSLLVTLFFLIILFFLNPSSCSSDELFFSYGLGVFKSAENVISETKAAHVGYRYGIFSPWSLQVKWGGWFDGSNNPIRSSSFYSSAGPQYIISTGYFEIRNGISVGFITNTDGYLGGNLNFNPELYVGVRDKEGSGIGIVYNHFSSAGLNPINMGRDFVLIELSGKF